MIMWGPSACNASSLCAAFVGASPESADYLMRLWCAAKMLSAIVSCVLIAVQIKGKKPVQIGTYATVIGGGWGIAAV